MVASDSEIPAYEQNRLLKFWEDDLQDPTFWFQALSMFPYHLSRLVQVLAFDLKNKIQREEEDEVHAQWVFLGIVCVVLPSVKREDIWFC